MKNLKNYFNKVYTAFLALLIPAISFAQTTTGTGTVCGPIKYAKSLQWYMCELYKILGQYLIPLLMIAATGYFMWGVIQFIQNAGNEKERKAYKEKMIWGVVALFVMLSVWGIIAILGQIVGTDTSVIPQIKYK